MKNWLVTGGCGFIGLELIKELHAKGKDRIFIADNLSVGKLESLQEICEVTVTDKENVPALISKQADKFSCTFMQADILDIETMKAIGKDMDVIVHLAANTGVEQSITDPRQDCNTNVIGTFNVLEAARQNEKSVFIFASSGAPVGEVANPPIHEEMAAHPVSPYGASKLAGEGYCSSYNRTYGVDTIALRFGNVYGPGSLHKGSVVAKFISDALGGKSLTVHGDGTQTRDFIYIKDLVNAIICASESTGCGGEIFQIATNSERTVGEIAAKLKTILDKKGVSGILIESGPTRLGDVKRNYSNIDKAKQRLGWTPKTSIDDGLTATVDYFIESNSTIKGSQS